MPHPETYLGDGVYASFDGYSIWLDTRAQEPVHRIALEPPVLSSLLRYAAQCGYDLEKLVASATK